MRWKISTAGNSSRVWWRRACVQRATRPVAGDIAKQNPAGSLVNDRFLRVQRYAIRGTRNTHFLPVVFELLPTIETDDVGTVPSAILRLRSASQGEGCPVVGTTENCAEQRVKHQNAPFEFH